MDYVYVYILTNNSDSPQTETATKLFNNDLFEISFAEAKEEEEDEYAKISQCLGYQEMRYPNSYMIIAKDSCTSGFSPDDIADVVRTARGVKDWDLCYLAGWMDRCDLNNNLVQTGTNSDLVDTYSPHGIQALMISPAARRMLLGKTKLRNGNNFEMKGDFSSTLNYYIVNKALKATRAKPSLIIYDSNLAKNNSDYIKTAECQVLPKNGENYQITTKPPPAPVQSNNGAITILIILGIIVFIAIIAFILMKSKKR